MSGKISDRIKIAAVAGNLAVIALLINLLSVPLFSPAAGWTGTDRQPEFAWGGLQVQDSTGFIFMIDENQCWQLGSYADKTTATQAANDLRRFLLLRNCQQIIFRSIV